MEITVGKVIKLTGVTARLLHYYDETGLLSPSRVSDAGYRYYDEKCLERLRKIMFYRELDFSLAEIAQLLKANPLSDREILLKQRELLTIKKSRTERLIKSIDDILKGEKDMSFNEFESTQLENAKEKYKQEVKDRWGDTAAYRESEKKTASYGKGDFDRLEAEAAAIFAEFAAIKGKGAASPEANALVKKWQSFITENYYTCTDEILRGLAAMYSCDGRFSENIDKAGEGTAAFITDCINAAL